MVVYTFCEIKSTMFSCYMIRLQYNANLRNGLAVNAILQIKTQGTTLFFAVVAHQRDGVWGGNGVVRSFSTLNF